MLEKNTTTSTVVSKQLIFEIIYFCKTRGGVLRQDFKIL